MTNQRRACYWQGPKKCDRICEKYILGSLFLTLFCRSVRYMQCQVKDRLDRPPDFRDTLQQTCILLDSYVSKHETVLEICIRTYPLYLFLSLYLFICRQKRSQIETLSKRSHINICKIFLRRLSSSSCSPQSPYMYSHPPAGCTIQAPCLLKMITRLKLSLLQGWVYKERQWLGPGL